MEELLKEMDNLLDEIEMEDRNNCSEDFNTQIERLYAYYVLDLLMCKLQNKDESSAKEGIRKTQELVKKYEKENL
ncbi:hypothetical protein EHP00_1615 [Ecytonucleospora hepatopenaei]|uniref:Uncharacterized protein n=1 Tax=Ecytonucleospora hepatopenaei TaxID=646526 RepID=A0A1W0E989_9MICR|nr:hypothetical protein EHP00_1615 [Ecytonucleospora hepatopenaei]